MTPNDVIEFYGTRSKAAAALGVTYEAVRQWVAAGYIAYERQCQIQVESGGALVARKADAGCARSVT